MSRWIVIFTVLVLFVIVRAALTPVSFDSPGLGGMNSNFDIQEIKPIQSPYMENADVTTTPGMLRKRFGMGFFGTNALNSYGSYGYYQPSEGWKIALGIVPLPSDSNDLNGNLELFDSSTWNAGQTMWEYGSPDFLDLSDGDSVDILGLLRTTDTFGLALKDNLPVPYETQQKAHIDFALPNNYQDFVAYDDFTITTDGSGPPMVYHMKVQATESGSVYNPRSTAMSLEAPGQPRVQIVNYQTDSTATILNGPVEYMYRYLNYSNTNEEGDTSIHSVIIWPKNQSVLISGFLPRPYEQRDTVSCGECDGQDDNLADTRLAIYRRRINVDPIDKWIELTKLTMKRYNSIAFLDTGVADNGVSRLAFVNDTIPTPGEVWYFGGDTTGTKLSQGSMAYVDSQYYIRYAWYDPVLDIEGPMGPISHDSDLVFIDAAPDTFATKWAIGALADSIIPAPWIRVYQTVTDGSFLFAGDSIIWYRVYESPATKFHDGHGMHFFVLGFLPDTAVVEGWDFKDYDTTYVDNINYYGRNNYSFEEDGTAFVRPPFIATNNIFYKDMTYANGRLWGFGDPFYPSRLYYSNYRSMGDWPITNFLSIAESDNDEIVAIETINAGNQDIIVILKHNSIYVIVGFDVEFDAVQSKVRANVGPVDKFSVINFDNKIYYLGTDMKIYQMVGFEVKEISQPIENYLDTFFTDYKSAFDSVRTIRIGQQIGWTHRRTGNTIMYDVNRRVWWINTWDTDFIPTGYFTYDTSRNQSGYNPDDVLLSSSDSSQAFRRRSTNFTDSTNGNQFIPPLIYQTPFIGDGEWLYEITYVDLMADWPNNETIELTIVDEEGTRLDSVTVTSDSRSSRLYRVGFPPNIGSYLAVRIDDSVSTDLRVHKITPYWRRVGREALE